MSPPPRRHDGYSAYPILQTEARTRRSLVSEEVLAEMVANVWKVLVAEGDPIEEGATICILESMKMEIPVEATASGTVSELKVTEGGVVQEGDVIAVID
jgi:biotin carboxyl carrier protein